MCRGVHWQLNSAIMWLGWWDKDILECKKDLHSSNVCVFGLRCLTLHPLLVHTGWELNIASHLSCMLSMNFNHCRHHFNICSFLTNDRVLLEAADPQELPSCPALQVRAFRISSSADFLYFPWCHLLLNPDSNNSGDNLYTMINTGPGNRNNVSSHSSWCS